ncbi:hypothetical protein JRQ81_008237 [Phrynocephalus forsythii]|uniref:Maestro-like HEAT-repeats domain-containing protein n=1 Tax=Phrynocephalus forsythii TaxID=171643 RepID=A0A9Q0Y4S4_9SAUR|nr:hypothetical protein JRQ81_008237 [Phrynocephalus forsythii]
MIDSSLTREDSPRTPAAHRSHNTHFARLNANQPGLIWMKQALPEVQCCPEDADRGGDTLEFTNTEFLKYPRSHYPAIKQMLSKTDNQEITENLKKAFLSSTWESEQKGRVLKTEKAFQESAGTGGWPWPWRLPSCKNWVHPIVESVTQTIQVLPPAAVVPAAGGERVSPATSTLTSTTRHSLAASVQSVGEAVCPENQGTTSSEELMRCSLASLGHSLGENICPEDAAEVLSSIMSQPVQAKQAVLEQVVAEPTPGNILLCALGALHHLSKMKPHTPWELEDRFLSLAIHAVLRLEEPSYDYVGQSLYRSSQQTLEVLLLGLLDEDPSSDHLFAILDSPHGFRPGKRLPRDSFLRCLSLHFPQHLQTGLHSQEDWERVWASGKITTVLRRATLLQKYNIMGDALGRYVAELGVLLMVPKRQVGHHAREGIYQLYELALQQRGIDIREMAGLWIREPHLDWEMASYWNTVQMAKKLDAIFTPEQRLAFLKTALQAVWDLDLQPALFLLYAFLGLGKEVLGMDAQGTEAKIGRQLHRLRECGKQPMELRRLLAGKDDVLIDNLEEEEETEAAAAAEE